MPQMPRWTDLDFDNSAQIAHVAVEAAAIANSGGGTVTVDSDLDVEALGALLDAHVAPASIEAVIERRSPDGQETALLSIPAAPEPPLVMATASEAFEANSVVVRRANRIERARHDDYQRWRSEAIDAARQTIVNRLTMVIDAPPTARIQVISGEQVDDEPNFLLSRSTDLFVLRPSRLLGPNDLVYLWLHRNSLDLSKAQSQALIIQSALRKRATLFLWLAEIMPDPADVRRQLRRAVTMSDRDKSDAARSILQVASLYLGYGEYNRLRTALAESGYRHMEQAANEWFEPEQARDAAEAVLTGRQRRLTDRELVAEAETLIREQPNRIARGLPTIGYALWQNRQAGH